MLVRNWLRIRSPPGLLSRCWVRADLHLGREVTEQPKPSCNNGSALMVRLHSASGNQSTYLMIIRTSTACKVVRTPTMLVWL